MHTVIEDFSYNGKWSVVFFPASDSMRVEVKAFNDFDKATAFAHYMNGGNSV